MVEALGQLLAPTPTRRARILSTRPYHSSHAKVLDTLTDLPDRVSLTSIHTRTVRTQSLPKVERQRQPLTLKLKM